MSDSIAVITGANGGLGIQTSIALARRGMSIVLACRDMDRAKQAIDALRAEVPSAEAMAIPLDVSEPESIADFGREFASQVGEFDLLINNAGIAFVPFERNRLGHEMHLATNHLGPFALTGTLLPCLRDDGEARIVNVGSLSHRFARLDLDDLNWERAPFDKWRAYGRSKLALQCFTAELDRRLRRANHRAIALTAHPGFADTDAGRNLPGIRTERGALWWLINNVFRPLIPEAHDAARSIIHAATAADVAGGDSFGPTRFFETRGAIGRARVNPAAHDPDNGRRLWALSEALTGVRYLRDS